ncbi:hypothetical protein ACN3XK_73485 [Actinomadura welshii]
MDEGEQGSAGKAWFRWPGPPKGLGMEALDGGARVGRDREEMNRALPARPGELRIRSLAYGRITSLDQARRWRDRTDSIVPVFAVDGTPVAAGYGTVTVPLGPGPHIVTVQTQDSKDDCCTAVAVDGGAGASLDYVAPYSSWKAAPEIADVSLHGRFGPAGILPEGWPGEQEGGPWRWGVLAAVAAAFVAGLVVARAGPPGPAALVAAVVVLPALAAGAAAGLLAGRRRKGMAAAADQRAGALPGAPPVGFGDAWHGGDGAAADARPRPRDPSHALIVVRQELRQWTDPVPEGSVMGDASLLPQTRLFTPPPRVTVGGRALPPGWGTWTVEVPPGRHRLGASLGGAHASQEVSAVPGGTAEVVLSVRMERRWSGSGAGAALVAETPVVAFARRG